MARRVSATAKTIRAGKRKFGEILRNRSALRRRNRCLSNAACDTSTRRCGNPEAVAEGITSVNITTLAGKPVTCPSLACRQSNACQPYSLVNSSDTIAKVCLVNATSAGAVATFTLAFVVSRDSDLWCASRMWRAALVRLHRVHHRLEHPKLREVRSECVCSLSLCVSHAERRFVGTR